MELKDKIYSINNYISENKWFDVEILNMKGGDLIIIGSTDFTYGHIIEIKFLNIQHISMNSEWSIETIVDFISIIKNKEEVININSKFNIIDGHILFKLSCEDGETCFYVAAMDIEVNFDNVYYFDKKDLKANERIADWVIHGNTKDVLE